MHYYLDVLKKYCVFSGRASRSEFWFFYLFNFIIIFIVFLIGLLFAANGKPAEMILFTIIIYLYGLAILLPTLGVAVRRLHDIGKGGGWIFIKLVPIIGWIWAIILYVTPSDPGENRFGPSLQGDPEV